MFANGGSAVASPGLLVARPSLSEEFDMSPAGALSEGRKTGVSVQTRQAVKARCVAARAGGCTGRMRRTGWYSTSSSVNFRGRCRVDLPIGASCSPSSESRSADGMSGGRRMPSAECPPGSFAARRDSIHPECPSERTRMQLGCAPRSTGTGKRDQSSVCPEAEQAGGGLETSWGSGSSLRGGFVLCGARRRHRRRS